MEKMLFPFAVSGIARPDKIRALIYANKQIAHAPLSEILRAALQGGETESGRYLRLCEGTTVQFGRKDQFDTNGQAVITLPVTFADALFCPFVTPCADLSRTSSFAAAVDKNHVTRTGFAVRIQSLERAQPPPAGCSVYWLAIGRCT